MLLGKSDWYSIIFNSRTPEELKHVRAIINDLDVEWDEEKNKNPDKYLALTNDVDRYLTQLEAALWDGEIESVKET